MTKRSNLTNFLKASTMAILFQAFVLSYVPGERDFDKSKELKLNKNDEVAYVSHKNEKEAINEIKDIAKESQYEESWLHFPSDKSWYEVGINSKIGEGKNYISKVEVDSGKFVGAIRNSDSKKAVLVHNHPGNEEVISTNDYTPSISDIKTLEKFRSLYKKIRPSGEIIGGIVSVHGLTSYEKEPNIFNDFLPKTIKNFHEFSYRSISNSLKEKSSFHDFESGLKIKYKEFEKVDYSKNNSYHGGGGKFYEILE